MSELGELAVGEFCWRCGGSVYDAAIHAAYHSPPRSGSRPFRFVDWIVMSIERLRSGRQ